MLLLDWDIADLKQFKGRKVERALIKAVRMAGGDSARSLRTESSRAIRKRKKFKLKTVNGALKVRFPKDVSSLQSLLWSLDVSGQPTRVGELFARQTKRGVSFSVNQGTRGFIAGAFVATMRSGHTGVFQRSGKGRLPIDEVFTSRISDVFRDTGFVPGQFDRSKRVFKTSFQRLFPLQLAKIK